MVKKISKIFSKQTGFIVIFLLVTSVCYGGADYDGVDDGFTCGSDTSLNPTTAVSVCAWINTDGNNTADDSQNIVDSRSDGQSNSHGWVLQYDSTGAEDRVRFFIYDTAFRGGGTFGLTADTWHHLCGTWSAATGDVQVYANGILRDTFSGHTTNIAYSGTHTTSIGFSKRSGDSEFFNGTITDPAVWDVKLTTAQVLGLFSSQFKRLSLQTQPANLQAYWPIDRCADGVSCDTLTFNDLSSNSNTCTADAGANTSLIGQEEKVLTY